MYVRTKNEVSIGESFQTLDSNQNRHTRPNALPAAFAGGKNSTSGTSLVLALGLALLVKLCKVFPLISCS